MHEPRRHGTGIATTSQADITHRSAVFRGLTGFNGTGVKIGVLSDGVEHLADAQASGDLGPVTVLPGQAGAGDEGTAMLELIHDMAPGAQLYFATAFTSITSFADNIRALRTAGCDIIVDDVGYFVESPFQDGQGPAVVSPTNGGVVTQAVKDVAALGAMYFSSAGNSGNLNDGTSGVWEGDFSRRRAQRLRPLPAGRPFTLRRRSGLQHPDAGRVRPHQPLLVRSARRLGQRLRPVPAERRRDGRRRELDEHPERQRRPVRADEQQHREPAHRDREGDRGRWALSAPEHQPRSSWRSRPPARRTGTPRPATSSPSAWPPRTSASRIRIRSARPTSIETFSSDGPRRVFFLGDGTAVTPGNFSSTGGAVLQKPDLTAADGVVRDRRGRLPRAVLRDVGGRARTPRRSWRCIKSQNPGFTQTQLRSALFATALDIEAPGVDRDSGIGIVMAAAPQPGCTFTLAPPTRSLRAAGGTGSITVTASSGTCNWVAWSNVPWITVTGNGVGVGYRRRLAYTVATNPGPARSGTITIQGGTDRHGQPGRHGWQRPSTTSRRSRSPTTRHVESSLTVSGLTRPIRNVTVSFHLTHTFDADLTISSGRSGRHDDQPERRKRRQREQLRQRVHRRSRRGRPSTTPRANYITQRLGAVRRQLPSGAAALDVQRQGRRGRQRHLEAENRRRVRRRYRQPAVLVAQFQYRAGDPVGLQRGRHGRHRGVSARRPASGSSGTRAACSSGDPSDIPVAGDYNGDGLEDIAVYPAVDRPVVRAEPVHGAVRR